MTMKLYHHSLSGHSHRTVLFASLLGLDVELVSVDLFKAEHKSPEFLAKNPTGQIPVLDDDGTLIQDSNAILVYLARKYDRNDWLPQDALAAAKTQRWLSFAAGELVNGAANARLNTVFGANYDSESAITQAHRLLDLMDTTLSSTPWLTGEQATIADIALYSYTANAPEGGVDLTKYESVLAWLNRIESLEGFVPFEKTEVGLRKAS